MKKDFQRSYTYTKILELLHDMTAQSYQASSYSNKINNGNYSREKHEVTSHRVHQSVTICEEDLSDRCEIYEWWIIGKICKQLKMYNALWHFNPDIRGNSSARKAVKGLCTKGIIIKTETPYIYLVNPLYIRKGELFAVLTTTASLLKGATAVTTDHIIQKQAVKNFQFSAEKTQQQIGYYGYSSDN